MDNKVILYHTLAKFVGFYLRDDHVFTHEYKMRDKLMIQDNYKLCCLRITAGTGRD